jgi:hypothetical protein
MLPRITRQQAARLTDELNTLPNCSASIDSQQNALLVAVTLEAGLTDKYRAAVALAKVLHVDPLALGDVALRKRRAWLWRLYLSD